MKRHLGYFEQPQNLPRRPLSGRILEPQKSHTGSGAGATGRTNDAPCRERQNLSMRMSIRRFTRLTNAFSKKVENHAAAVALWFMYYNFCRVHRTLRVTPAMEAGISTHVWTIEELCGLLPQPISSTRETENNLVLKALGE